MKLRLQKTWVTVCVLSTDDRRVFLFFRSEKRKRHLTSESDMAEDYPKENDSSR